MEKKDKTPYVMEQTEALKSERHDLVSWLHRIEETWPWEYHLCESPYLSQANVNPASLKYSKNLKSAF